MNKGKRSETLVTVLALAVLGVFILSPGNLMAASGKPIELSFALHIPPKSSPYTNAFLPWAQEIEKRANGRLKFKFYLSQTLVKVRDAYDAVKNGIADISWVSFSLNRGRFPLTSVMELPFLSSGTFTGSHTLIDLYKKFPELRAEVEDVHLLSLWVSLPYELHTVKKPVATLEDVKGLKLATMPAASAAVDAIGGIPVTTGLPAVYTMLEKGVADGTVVAWGALNTFKLYEVTKYHANAHLGGVPYAHFMNKRKWQKLPEDLKAIITSVTQEMLPDKLCSVVTQEANKGIQTTMDRGNQIITLNPDEQKRWKATAENKWDNWVNAMNKKGLPGKAVLSEAIQLVEKYKDYNKN